LQIGDSEIFRKFNPRGSLSATAAPICKNLPQPTSTISAAAGSISARRASQKTHAARPVASPLDNCILQGGGRQFAGRHRRSGSARARTTPIGPFANQSATGITAPSSIGWTWGYQPRAVRRQPRGVLSPCIISAGVCSAISARSIRSAPQPHTVIRGCRVHDISCASYGGLGPVTTTRARRGILWENNLVYSHAKRAAITSTTGRENIIRNNIFGFAKEFQVRRRPCRGVFPRLHLRAQHRDLRRRRAPRPSQ